MIAIRTEGPVMWSVYAPNTWDPAIESRYFGPDTLDACVEAARTLHSVLPSVLVMDTVTRYCVACGAAAEVETTSTDAWGEYRCADCVGYAERCDAPIDDPPCHDNGRCAGHEAYHGAGTLNLRYCDDDAPIDHGLGGEGRR